MIKKKWARFKKYENCLAIFFMANIILDLINKKFLKLIIPPEIVGYLFWLSLGLYFGFRLCKYEYNRASQKQIEKYKQN